MYAEIGHKISRSALCISLAACVALCVTVTPNQKAYADYNTFYDENWNPGNDIFTGYGLGLNDSVHGMINMMTASAQAVYVNAQNMDYLVNQITNDYVRSIYKTLKHFDYHFYDIQAFLTSQNDYVNIGGQSMGSAANVHTLHYYLNNGLNNLVYIYSDTNMMRQFLTSQSNAFVSGGTSYNTLKYYLDLYVNENVSMVTYLNEMKDDIDTGTTYLQNIMSDVDFIGGFLISDTVLVNGDSTYTPYYYLKSASAILIDLENNLNLIKNRLVANNATISEIASSINNKLTASGSTISELVRNINNKLIASDSTISELVYSINSKLTSNNATVAELMVSTNSKLSQLHTDFGTLETNISNIGNSVNAILALIAMDDVVSDVVGDFDSVDFSDNVDDVKDDMQNIAVYSSVVALGTYISQLNVQPVNDPSITMPFTFAGSNENVVISVSWLDDVKPLINFALLFMLFLGLTAWSVNIVSRGQS